MDALILYMAKASALVALFYGAYWLLLKKQTFFTANRWFLISGLVTALLLPLGFITRVVWVAPQPVQVLSAQDLQLLLQYSTTATTVMPKAPRFTWQDIALAVYIMGVLLFIARMLTDVATVMDLIKGKPAVKHGRLKYIDAAGVESPFSFFNYIVYNSAALKPHELDSILAHEKVHSNQRHSMDMVMGQLFCALFWFNPFVWLYKKAITQNLEFIADSGATQQLPDAVAYQKTMLKMTLQPENIAITNHFYQSLIKKRIVMLNTKKSRRRSSWRYAAVMPALAAFVLAFQVKVVAQEKQEEPKAATIVADIQEWNIVIEKNTTDKQLEEHKRKLKSEFKTNVEFSKVKRNSKNEITGIKVAYKAEGKDNVYEVSGNQPIKTFTIELVKESNGSYTVSYGTVAYGVGLKADDIKTFSATVADTVSYATGYAVTPPLPPQPPLSKNTQLTIDMLNPTQKGGTALNFSNSDALIVINGTKYSKGQDIKLPAGHTVSAITTLNGKEGKKKYGKEGKEGVIEIATAASNTFTYTTDRPQVVFGRGYTNNVGELGSAGVRSFAGVDFSTLEEWEGMSDEEKQNLLRDVMVFKDLEKFTSGFNPNQDIIRLQVENNLQDMLNDEKMKAERHEAIKQRLEAKKAEMEKRRSEFKKRGDDLKKKAEEKRRAEELRAKAKENKQ